MNDRSSCWTRTRPGLAMRPGRPARVDYEYVREGTANIFCIVEPLTGRRLTYALKNRKGRAFARALQRIDPSVPRRPQDSPGHGNLSTHRAKSLIDALGARVRRRLWNRFEIHHTPKHASWLNAAEMEASLVSRECLGHRRIGHLHALKSQIAAWRVLAGRSLCCHAATSPREASRGDLRLRLLRRRLRILPRDPGGNSDRKSSGRPP
jgi:hypothetical protein